MDATFSSLPKSLVILVLLVPVSVLYITDKVLVPDSVGLDNLHYCLFQLFVVVSFRSLLGLPDPAGLFIDKPLRVQTSTIRSLSSSDISTDTSSHTMAKKVAAKASVTSSNEVASSSKAQQLPSYAAETDAMVAKFLKMADMENLGNPNPEWTLIVDELPFIQVYQHISSEHCYKIVVTLDASLYTTFNILADITRRKEWDQMVDETMILQEYSPSTKVQYMRMKPVWPTSARDVVVMAHCRSVDGRLLNVTKSVDHDDMPSREADGVVRMQAGIAGQILETVNVDGVEKTRVVQIADGDPKGWIPKSVVKFVATKALPGSFRHLNKLVAKLPPLNSTNLLIDFESGLPLGSSPTTSGHVSSVEVSSQADSTVAVPAKKAVAVPSVEVKKADRAVAKKYPVSNRFILWIHGYLKFGSPFMVTTMFVLYMIGLYKKR